MPTVPFAVDDAAFMAEPSSSTTTAVPGAGSAAASYRTQPNQGLSGVPPGVPYIIGNEAAERFSFYGMRSILTVFMTTYLMNGAGQLAVMNQNEATAWSHEFVAAVYFTPILGALLSDGILGKYRTIIYLSIAYCFGHLALALNDTRLGLFIGLGLIALGAGGIKPCVSAHVGDQFGKGNQHLLTRVFGWFYFSINVGSSVSIYLCPILLNNPRFGPHYAFGLPGVLMFLATVTFWLGRKKFVHIPPGGPAFIKEFFSKEGLSALGRLCLIYVFIVFFWALWDQSAGIEWTLQAQKMDLTLWGFHLLPEQVQVTNGLFVLAFIPLFNYGLYPVISRFFPLTPLRKIGLGLFLLAGSFALVWWIQTQIDGGAKPNVGWQILAYAILTASEVMVSITALEFSYTQAPRKMKSALMAAYLLTVTLGNQFDAFLNFLIPTLRRSGMNLDGAAYFRFFTLLMVVVATAFIFISGFYRGRTYLQGEEDSGAGALT
ncbi:MAG TPA: POT family MFS transporter [Chthoniobacterales bacterium]